MQDIILNFIEKEIILEEQEEPLKASDDLLLSGRVDSMGMMKLVQFIEQKIGKTIPPEDLVIENFMTVEAIVSYLNESK